LFLLNKNLTLFFSGRDPQTNECIVEFVKTPTRVIYPQENEVAKILEEFHECGGHAGTLENDKKN
jgi:hypothetical protein